MDVGVHLLVADDVAQQVEVAVELAVDRQQVAQLAVVDADIGVDQFSWRFFIWRGFIEEIEHHVGIVEDALGFLGEPIAICTTPALLLARLRHPD